MTKLKTVPDSNHLLFHDDEQNLYYRFDPDDLFAPTEITIDEAYQLCLDNHLEDCRRRFYSNIKSKSLLFDFSEPELDLLIESSGR